MKGGISWCGCMERKKEKKKKEKICIHVCIKHICTHTHTHTHTCIYWWVCFFSLQLHIYVCPEITEMMKMIRQASQTSRIAYSVFVHVWSVLCTCASKRVCLCCFCLFANWKDCSTKEPSAKGLFHFGQYSSSSAFPAISLGFTILGEVFAYVTIFWSNHRCSCILSSWMVHAGCVFVAAIHLSRTWVSWSFKSLQ